MKKWLNKGKIEYQRPFLLGVLAMFLCLVAGGVVLGNSTIMESDLVGTYVPAMRSFTRNLLSGKGLSISWDNCLGSNTTAYNAYYVGGSVANLLYVFFIWMNPEKVVLLVILVKTGLAAVSFCYFMKKFDGKDQGAALFFGIFYATSSFQVFINTINIIWMDAVYILPLILGLIIELKRNHKWRGLCIAYVYLFITNFYMAYMVGIFSALFFFLLFFFDQKEKQKGENGKMLLGYIGIVLLAVCISAVVLLPAAIFILTKGAPDATGELILHVSLLQVYNQLFLGQNGDVMFTLPCLYAGLPMLLLVPFFFGKSVVDSGKKYMLGILTVIMGVSCFVPFLYLFWHAMDVPDGWPYRFSFILSFLGCVMGCMVMEQIEKIRKNYVLLWIAFNLVVYGVGYLVQRKIGENTNSIHGFLLNGGFLLVWFACFFLKRTELKKYVLVLAILEVTINGYTMLEIHERPGRESYMNWYENGNKAAAELGEDPGLYRVNIDNDRQFGTDMFFGFYGIGDFGTMENYQVRRCLSNLGVYTSPRITYSEGITPFTQLILGIKYNIPSMYGPQGEMCLLPYDRYLSFGFMVEEDTIGVSLSDRNVYENSNRLASAMMGEEVKLFTQVAPNKISMVSNEIGMGQLENGKKCLFAYTEPVVPCYMTIRVPDEGKEIYCTFDSGASEISFEDPYIVDQYTNDEYQIYDYKRLGIRFAKRMDLVEDERMMAICMQNGISGVYMEFQDYWVYELSEERMEALYLQLSQSQLQVNSYKNGVMKGTVDVEADHQILFTSIPYDEGWRVTSKQGDIEVVPLLDGAFLGVRFSKSGNHELEFRYKAPGSNVGMVMSIVGVLVLLLVGNPHRVQVRDKLEEK